MKREASTLEAMVRIFCRGRHGGGKALCPECSLLLEYALERLERCRFGEAKPVCSACPAHCYKPVMREGIREVMRYSGPRMLLAHPILAVLHLLHAGKG